MAYGFDNALDSVGKTGDQIITGNLEAPSISIGGQGLSIYSGLKNKIINGRLSNPINQRAAASIIATSSAYNYDRWYYDGTYLYYGVEDKDIYNETLTLSWLSDATAEYQLITTATTSSGLSAITTGWTSVSNGGNFTLSGVSGNNLWLRFTVGVDGFTSLDDVQLEVGSVATPFEQRPIGLEEMLCKRYYERFGMRNIGIVSASNSISFAHTFEVEKRTAGTITLLDTSVAWTKPGVTTVTSSSSVLTSPQVSKACNWSITGFTGLTINDVGYSGIEGDYLEVDAEL